MEYTAMTEDSREDSPEQPSVFANLPASRPGARSPRRKSPGSRTSGSPHEAAAPQARPAARQAAPGEEASAPRGDRATRPEASERPEPPASDAPAPAEASPEAERGVGLEDLAWAGVAAAAEAATIGVRLASRAMEALRGSDRR
jgi:hypothetical protein